jgi:hypothetical protein
MWEGYRTTIPLPTYIYIYITVYKVISYDLIGPCFGGNGGNFKVSPPTPLLKYMCMLDYLNGFSIEDLGIGV